MFALAGVFGVLSGLALIGNTTSADANIGNGYTLLSIGGVILGGGEFAGGRVSPIGAVIGALTLALAAAIRPQRLNPQTACRAAPRPLQSEHSLWVAGPVARTLCVSHRSAAISSELDEIQPSRPAGWL